MRLYSPYYSNRWTHDFTHTYFRTDADSSLHLYTE